jgi:ABC-type molybdate transport system ATPase subunit
MIKIAIKKRFADFSLDVELELGREFVALTGANGSGKTTLLRLIAGLDKPDSGEITVSGRTFYDEFVFLPPELRRVGYVFQDAALFPWLSVEANIRFGLGKAEKASDETDKWLSELYDEAGIDHLLGRMPKNLSGGEAERVAIVRALAGRPEILLLDEPFSAVDMDLKPALRKFMKKIQREWEIPVLMVTHDHGEVHTMADKLYKLEDGRVVDSTRKGRLSVVPQVSY